MTVKINERKKEGGRDEGKLILKGRGERERETDFKCGLNQL